MQISDPVRLLLRLGCFVPFLVVTPLANWVSEREQLQSIFMSDYDRMAGALLRKQAVWIGDAADERPLKVSYLGRAPRKEVLVLGSSRAMEISPAWFEPRDGFNAAVRLGGLDDYVALFQLCLETGKLPQFMILELNPALTSRLVERRDWRILAPYFDRALARYQMRKPYRRVLSGLLAFQQLRFNMRALVGVPWAVSTRGKTDKCEVLPDGQEFFGAVQDQTPGELRDRVTRNLSNADSELNDARAQSRPEEGDLELLRRFLDDILSRRIRLVVFLAPVHPIAYGYYAKVGGFDEHWIRKELADRGVSVIGSYSPTIAGAVDSDFFDDVHPRPEICKRLFAKANIINESGGATSYRQTAMDGKSLQRPLLRSQTGQMLEHAGYSSFTQTPHYRQTRPRELLWRVQTAPPSPVTR
ncbi:MAG: hypothetical protein LAO18_21865 [Acidobacteriia bacterium]|nr:hypothetical protein [Terriglobia bacterium]